MSKPIVTPFQVADCNAELARADIPARVRLTDSCGGQTLRLETEDANRMEARAAVHRFFNALGMDAQFQGESEYFTLT